MKELDPDEDFLAKLVEEAEKILGPLPEDATISEILCWLKARREDLEREQTEKDRAAGSLADADCELFYQVLRPFASDTPIGKAMEFLRAKRRKGHKQRMALEIWDRYYKDKPDAELYPQRYRKHHLKPAE